MSKESEAVREWVKATSCYPLPTDALEKVCADADRCAELATEVTYLEGYLQQAKDDLEKALEETERLQALMDRAGVDHG